MLVMFGAGIMVGILILLALLGLTKREEPAGCVVALGFILFLVLVLVIVVGVG